VQRFETITQSIALSSSHDVSFSSVGRAYSKLPVHVCLCLSFFLCLSVCLSVCLSFCLCVKLSGPNHNRKRYGSVILHGYPGTHPGHSPEHITLWKLPSGKLPPNKAPVHSPGQSPNKNSCLTFRSPEKSPPRFQLTLTVHGLHVVLLSYASKAAHVNVGRRQPKKREKVYPQKKFWLRLWGPPCLNP